jgi:hypothetical protein
MVMEMLDVNSGLRIMVVLEKPMRTVNEAGKGWVEGEADVGLRMKPTRWRDDGGDGLDVAGAERKEEGIGDWWLREWWCSSWLPARKHGRRGRWVADDVAGYI